MRESRRGVKGRFPHRAGEMSRSDKGGRAACGRGSPLRRGYGGRAVPHRVWGKAPILLVDFGPKSVDFFHVLRDLNGLRALRHARAALLAVLCTGALRNF